MFWRSFNGVVNIYVILAPYNPLNPFKMKKSFLFLVGIFALISDFFLVKHNAAKQATGMALIKMSSIGITNLSGKAGGSIYSRNRGGSYVKNFVMPVNTFSAARQLVRATFGAISAGWRLLSVTERQTFIDQAVNYPTLNALGDTNVLSGNSLFIMLNKNLVNAGLSQITEAQAPLGTNAIFGASAVPVFDIGLGSTFTFANSLQFNNATTINDYVLEATPGVSSSINYVDNRFRVLALTAAAAGTQPVGTSIAETNFAATGAALKTAYESQFGAPSENSVVWFRIKAVNPKTGEASAYFTQKATVIST